METKRDRFVRIAERRVNRILSDLESLARCANKKNYAYEEADVREIFTELEKKLKEVKSLYTSPSEQKTFFKLSPK